MAEYSWKKWGDEWMVRVWDPDADLLARMEMGHTQSIEVKKKNGQTSTVDVNGIEHEDRRVAILRPVQYDKPSDGNGDKQEVDPDLEAGVYETDDGIFVVKPNRRRRGSTPSGWSSCTAGQGDRVNEEGDAVRIEFEYDRGAIFNIKPDDRMELERAKELAIRYGRCINCGRKLEVKESVERGIGPVCVKAFRVTA